VAEPPESVTLVIIRRVLLAILVIGMAGTSIELLLLKHVEEATQLVPLVLLGLAFVSVAWHAARPSVSSVMTLQIVMVLFVASGLIGMVLHYQANVEFQHEMDRSLAGMPLFWKVMAAKAPPALAPGSMSQLGLIGLAYSYRYPVERT
jgi:Na+/alanine symporter